MKENMSEFQSPAIILVGAQLGENIGTVARAMLNFGLTDLRLVRPRPDWQIDRARKAAAGAESLIDNRALFDTVAEATADLGFVVATSKLGIQAIYIPELGGAKQSWNTSYLGTWAWQRPANPGIQVI